MAPIMTAGADTLSTADPVTQSAPLGGMRRRSDTLSRVMSALIMYSTTWCGYCKRLKTALKAEGISYTEIDIEQDPAAAEFVGSVNNGNHVVPTVKFADGSTLTNPSIKDVKAKLN